MAWNIEIVAARTTDLADAVPDLFGLVGQMMGFEDATSSSRAPHLCVGRVRDWAVVFDVACRLSGFEEYLTTASADTDLHLVRVADQPVALHYRHGRAVSVAHGLAGCRAVAPRADRDGEQCAFDILEQRTGVTYSPDMWDASYTLAAID